MPAGRGHTIFRPLIFGDRTMRTLHCRRPFAVAVTLIACVSIPAADRPGNIYSVNSILESFEKAKAKYLRNVRIRSVETSYAAGQPRQKNDHIYIAGATRFMLRSRDATTPDKWSTTWIGTRKNLYDIQPGKNGKGYVVYRAVPNTDQNFFAVCRTETGATLPLAILDASVVEYLKLRDLTVQNISASDFEGRPAAKVTTHRTIKSGVTETFLLDPTRDWILLSNELRMSGASGRTITTVAYAQDNETPKRMEYGSRSGEGVFRPGTTVDIVEFRREEVPDDELSFAQFGLPEPVDEPLPPPRRPVYLWLLAAAIGFAAAAAAFRFLARRQHSGTGTPHPATG
jgi:hypothetical protein